MVAPSSTIGSVIAQIMDEGWKLDKDKSGQDNIFQLTHPGMPGKKITIVGAPDQFLGPKALMSILNQAGLTPFKG